MDLSRASACAFVIAIVLFPVNANGEQTARLLRVDKVWDEDRYNAFTDLVRFNNAFYLAFRESTVHQVPPVGQAGGDLRVLRSEDGVSWSSVALISGGIDRDLRDAKLAVTSDGRLMLEGAAAPHSAPTARQSLAWFSPDGQTWSDAASIGDPGYWLWGVEWHNDKAYSIGYGPYTTDVANWTTRLYRSDDGTDFESLVPVLTPQGGTSEGSLLFRDDGSAIALVRRDASDRMAIVGTSQGDFTSWNWQTSNVQFGGPALIELPNGKILAAGRRYDGTVRTSLNYLDPVTGTLDEILVLPSGGDTSYPGLVWHDDKLFVSYYSSHQGNPSIYMAQVQFDDERTFDEIRHQGSANPLQEGWSPQSGGVAIAANGPIDDNGVGAWEIHDQLTTGGSREAWTTSLLANRWSQVAAEGWRFKASVRVVGISDVPDGAIELSVFPNSDEGYMLWLGADANGNPLVAEYGGSLSGGAGVRRTITLNGTGYHDYEMVYSPTDKTVDVYADGILVLENMASMDREGGSLNRILWGSNASTGTGRANFATIEFSLSSAATAAADFNQDGVVDGADFLLWQRQAAAGGGSGSADANRDGVVDRDDLTVWKEQFGHVASMLAIVPEPSSLTLLLQLAAICSRKFTSF